LDWTPKATALLIHCLGRTLDWTPKATALLIHCLGRTLEARRDDIGWVDACRAQTFAQVLFS